MLFENRPVADITELNSIKLDLSLIFLRYNTIDNVQSKKQALGTRHVTIWSIRNHIVKCEQYRN